MTNTERGPRTEWKCGEETSLLGIPVVAKDRMTADEMRFDLVRAEALLDELEGYPVDRITAYGSLGRIGVHVSPGHDPLRNGILTGNVERFDVEAVSPVDDSTVYIRFQDTERD